MIPAKSASTMQNRLPLPTSPANLLPHSADKSETSPLVFHSAAMCLTFGMTTAMCAMHVISDVFLVMCICHYHVLGMMMPFASGILVVKSAASHGAV